MKRLILAIVPSAVLFSLPLASQQKASTLREHARTRGEVHIISYPEDLFLENFDQLISRSQFIIKGKVVDEKARLSKNEYSVFTDYTIVVMDILKDTKGLLSIGDKIAVSKLGGNIVLDGKPVRMETPDQPPVPWITPHIFFIEPLVSPEADYQYGFVGGSIGAFEISRGRMTCRGLDAKIKNDITRQICNQVTVDDFIRNVRAKVAEQSRGERKP